MHFNVALFYNNKFAINPPIMNNNYWGNNNDCQAHHSKLPRHVVRVFIVLVQITAIALQLCVRRSTAHSAAAWSRLVMVRLAVIPDCVAQIKLGDFLPRALHPVAGRRYQVVGILLAEFVCKRQE